MDYSAITTLIAALLGTVVGGVISYMLNRQLHHYQLTTLREEHKTEYVAEETARHFLNHKSFTDRSFDVLKKHLGGFSDDELRKILVRAGAIRVFKEDGTEWWRLLDRMEEYVEKKKHPDLPEATGLYRG